MHREIKLVKKQKYITSEAAWNSEGMLFFGSARREMPLKIGSRDVFDVW